VNKILAEDAKILKEGTTATQAACHFPANRPTGSGKVATMASRKASDARDHKKFEARNHELKAILGNQASQSLRRQWLAEGTYQTQIALQCNTLRSRCGNGSWDPPREGCERLSDCHDQQNDFYP
jgi:hypothetical protein